MASDDPAAIAAVDPNPILKLDTVFGQIVIELRVDRAPRTARHVLALAANDMLSGASFYRATSPDPDQDPPLTIDVIQGGVGWERCEGLPSVEHEPTSITELSHLDGAVSIGRWADRPATSEIFICIGDQRSLDARPGDAPFSAGFAVFGQVVRGMDAVRAIHRQPRLGVAPAGHERFSGQFLTRPVPFYPIPDADVEHGQSVA